MAALGVVYGVVALASVKYVFVNVPVPPLIMAIKVVLMSTVLGEQTAGGWVMVIVGFAGLTVTVNVDVLVQPVLEFFTVIVPL